MSTQQRKGIEQIFQAGLSKDVKVNKRTGGYFQHKLIEQVDNLIKLIVAEIQGEAFQGPSQFLKYDI